MKHILKSMLTATAAVAILASGAIAEDAPRKGGTLITVMATNVRNLNPAVQSGIVTGYPGAQLFAAPLRYDEDWTPQQAASGADVGHVRAIDGHYSKAYLWRWTRPENPPPQHRKRGWLWPIQTG
jgi:hypothetical protein